jgi:hypothetical protein
MDTPEAEAGRRALARHAEIGNERFREEIEAGHQAAERYSR